MNITKLQPAIIKRSEHSISRADISASALKVLYRLHGAGYQACLVGGGVRDLLLGNRPKDFDISTDAHPEEVAQLFRNCRLIGRRFRLAHVHFGRELIEVATFRALHDANSDDINPEDALRSENGLIISDNVYGSIEEDALRRDFTINALYYDIDDFAVLDYTGGLADLDEGIIRLIGDPEERYREDPVRMLRAVRFAAKLGFRLAPETEAPIHRLYYLLEDVPSARLFDEVLKLFLCGHAEQTYELLRLYGLFGQLMPMTERCLHSRQQPLIRRLLKQAFINTDLRIAEDKPVTPAFLFAVLLWGPLQERIKRLLSQQVDEREALQLAADEVILAQTKNTALPRRFSAPMREIWTLQSRFEQRRGKRPLRLLSHARFRAAYDFLLLRAQVGEPLEELADWWTRIQELSPAQQEHMVDIKPKKVRNPRYAREAVSTAR